jgi:hypothetical protein
MFIDVERCSKLQEARMSRYNYFRDELCSMRKKCTKKSEEAINTTKCLPDLRQDFLTLQNTDIF